MIANSQPHRGPFHWSAIAFLSLVLAACQMPSTMPPTGSSAPSTSSGGASSGGLPPTSSESGGGNTGSSAPSADGNQGGNNGGMPSPSGSQQGGATSGSTGQSLEDLDQALDDSLEGFDDTVGSQGATGAEIDILSPTGGGGGMQVDSDTPLFEEGGIGTMAEANAEIESRAAEGRQSEASEPGASDAIAIEGGPVGATTAGSESGDTVPIPEDIGDGQGDDIVLRQIRNAAINESDPVLREKLWDEYRRMKNQ